MGNKRHLIDEIGLHIRPEEEALLANWLAKRCGSVYWPGIDKAKTVFVNAGPPPDGLTAEEWEKQRGRLYLDTGLGRYDHHGQNKNKGMSVPDILVADLGLHHDKALQPIISWIRAQDQYGTNIHSEKPEDQLMSISADIRGLNLSPHGGRVVFFADIVFDALYTLETYRISHQHLYQPEKINYKVAFYLWLMKRFGGDKFKNIEKEEIITIEGIINRLGLSTIYLTSPDYYNKLVDAVAERLRIHRDPALERMLLFFRKGAKIDFTTDKWEIVHQDTLMTTMSALNGLELLNWSYPKILFFAFCAFNAKYLLMQDKEQAKKDFLNEDKTRFREVTYKDYKSEKVIKVISMVSDTYNAARIARQDFVGKKFKADAVIVLRPKGKQIQISSNYKVNLANVAVFLRAYENQIRGRETRSNLRAVGFPDEDNPEWYLAEFFRLVTNGTMKNRGVPPTAIPFDLILDLVCHALEGKLPGDRACTAKEYCNRRFCYFYPARLPVCWQFRHK